MSTGVDNRANVLQLSRSRIAQLFFVAMILATLYGVYRIVEPFLHAIILAALLSSVCYPLLMFVQRRVDRLKRLRLLAPERRRQTLAAAVTAVMVGLVVIVPLVVFTVMLVQRGVATVQAARQWVEADKLAGVLGSDALTNLLESAPFRTLSEVQQRFLPHLELSREAIRAHVVDLVQKYSPDAMRISGSTGLAIIGNTFQALFNFVLMIFLMFYFFRDGPAVMGYLHDLSPLSDEHESMLLRRIKSVSRSAVVGTVLTAAAQGGLAMIAFGVVGIPWFFWGVILGFSSLVPVVGTALVWVPCVGYLLLTSPLWKGIFLTAWCIGVVGLADNVLRPYLMQGESGMSGVVLFFAILGGIHVFGVIGVIYGPLVFGLFAVLLYIYLEGLRANGDTPPAGGAHRTDRQALGVPATTAE